MLALIHLLFSARAALIAENLFLRKQLALFREREVKPQRSTVVLRLTLLALARFVNWREALRIVKPDTFIKWHQMAFRMLWRWKSRKRGRPTLRKDIRRLIQEMDRDNPTWGEERIANELSLKLGILVSPRAVRKYLDSGPRRGKSTNRRWSTFVRNRAKAIVACDFLVSVTARIRLPYVFLAMEVSSRRIVHVNVTEHPNAEWTIQQLREFLSFDHPSRFLNHDRDNKFPADFDRALKTFGVRGLKTPVRTPTANAYAERAIGTLRRDCLDYLFPLSDRHLKATLNEFVTHFNRGRPHSALGPGIPEPTQATVPASQHRRQLPPNSRVKSRALLGGLDHEYRLEKEAA